MVNLPVADSSQEQGAVPMRCLFDSPLWHPASQVLSSHATQSFSSNVLVPTRPFRQC